MALYRVTAASHNPADKFVARDSFFFPVGKMVVADLTAAQAAAYALETGWVVAVAAGADVASTLTSAADPGPAAYPIEPDALPYSTSPTLPPRAVDPVPIPFAEEI